MSWPMQGSWNPGMSMPMAPDMSMAAGAAGYAPEQWTALQQQNWQQWAQWQQQYAQWQSQYGEKYAQQMQAMQQQMGNAPPLPTTSAVMAPAPPPPDNPPPPPPHENNQPLYGNKPQPKPNPVAAPASNQMYNAAGYNSNFATGNNQNWTGPAEQRPPGNQLSVNAEALKKLAEEERLFDIQFQKWEEEIEKWKRENVNHPDKQAYKEYEDKFEACRKQLMERREQMKQKRARLLSNAPQPAGGASASTGNNNHKVPTAIPPPLQNANMSRNNAQSQQYQSEPYKYPKQDQHNSPYQYSDVAQTGHGKRTNNTVDPQDRYESYQTIEDYSSSDTNKTSFLPTSGSQKGIPGLDLVPEANKASGNKDADVIEIADGDEQTSQEPDYTTISKGINNILGDEKIMNILSMVRDQTTPKDGMTNHNVNVPSANVSYPPNANMNMPPNANANRPPNVHANMPPNANANMPPNANANRPPNAHANMPPNANANMPPNANANMPPNATNMPHNVNLNMPPPANVNMQQGNQWNRNDNAYGNQQFNNNRPNEPYNRQVPNYPPPLMGQKTPYNNDRQGNMPQDYYNNDQYPDQMPRGGPPNMRQMPPAPQQNMPGQNLNQYPTGPYDQREMFNQNDNINRGMPDQRGMLDQRNMAPQGMPPTTPLLSQPAKPKWKEEPLFTPSIIVEYEHKPLRQKAREFIEPVHMFDYNHKSKDDEYKRHDIEKEVDELFTRIPRRLEDERDDRYLRDPVTRDYERRAPRDEFHDDYRARPPVREDEYRGMPPIRNDEYRGKPPMRDDEYRGRPPMRDDEFRGKPPMRDDEFRGKPPIRDDEYRKPPIREDDFDRRRLDVRHDDRRRDDRRDDRRDERDRYSRRDDFRERDRDRDLNRDRHRDHRDEDRRPRSRSRDRDRKRHISIESEHSTNSKKSKESEIKRIDAPKHIIMIDDILEPPGREMRPEKIVIIMRGPPGSGKSYLAKLIRDKEAEYGGTVRIMSIDDYFMQEGEVEEKDPTTGKIVKKPLLKYEYDEKLEETYLNSLKRAFKRSITDGYFTFLIYDAVNDQLKSYADIWNYARQNGFQVYVCTGDLDPQTCFKNNIHGRSKDDIEVICSRFFPTPSHHIELDPTNLLQSASIQEVHMEDVVEDLTADDEDPEDPFEYDEHSDGLEEVITCDSDTDEQCIMKTDFSSLVVESVFTSKWEKMDDAHQLARLDGTSRPLRPSQFSMEDYLQLDEWTPNKAKPGKKSVRWADIEERREQEKMRAIGFVVGKTDWNRMTDPTMGSSALTQTKYIERVRRN